MEDAENSKKSQNLAKTVFFTILLGAIGSGFWELFLSDVVYWIWKSLVQLVSIFSNSLLDNIHSSIGKGYSGSFGSWNIVVFTCVGMGGLFWLATINLLKTSESLFPKVYFLGMAIVMTLALMNYGYRVHYTNQAVIFVERSIDILAPYIPNEKVLILRSNYRSVDNREKFLELIEETKSLANKTDVSIPEFSPL